MKLAQNDKCPVLPQSCAVCRRGLLVPRARTDHLPIPFDPELCGTTPGGVSRWTNGHEHQWRHPLRGFGTTSHQAPCRYQHWAVQKAGLPHELQAARTSENEFMMLGSPVNIRTHRYLPSALSAFLLFRFRDLDRRPNIDWHCQCWSQLFQRGIASSFSWIGPDYSPHAENPLLVG